MNNHQHHESLLGGIMEHLKPLFDSSEQGMYVYLDDAHAEFNGKLATLLKYRSTEEIAKRGPSFLEDLVAEGSRNALVTAYNAAMNHGIASTLDVTWKAKDGAAVKTKMILAPIGFEGHMFALHFVWKT